MSTTPNQLPAQKIRIQPHTTFLQNAKASQSVTPINYRPTLSNTQTKLDPAVAQEIVQTFRQTFDILYAIRDAGGPTSLFAVGDPNAAAITVPVTAAETQFGTSLGIQVQLTRPGNWTISTAVCLNIIGDTSLFTVTMLFGSVALPYVALRQTTANEIGMLYQTWQVQADGGEICVPWIKKASGAGTSTVTPANTTVNAEWMGP